MVWERDLGQTRKLTPPYRIGKHQKFVTGTQCLKVQQEVL